MRFLYIISIPDYVPKKCADLIRKFLVINPTHRSSLEAIMQDEWMNQGYENRKLKPYTESEQKPKNEEQILIKKSKSDMYCILFFHQLTNHLIVFK